MSITAAAAAALIIIIASASSAVGAAAVGDDDGETKLSSFLSATSHSADEGPPGRRRRRLAGEGTMRLFGSSAGGAAAEITKPSERSTPGARSGCGAYGAALDVPLEGRWVPMSPEEAAADAVPCDVFDRVPIFTVKQKRLFDADLAAAVEGGGLRRRGKMPPKYITPPCGNKGGSPYAAKRFVPAAGLSDASAADPNLGFDADAFMGAMAGRHLVMLGDSLLRQLTKALACALHRAGHTPANVTLSEKEEVALTYANGFTLSRWALLSLSPYMVRHVEEMLAQGDVVIAGLGRHYKHTDARGSDGYRGDVVKLVRALKAAAPGRAMLLETLPAHFPTFSGDFFDPRQGAAWKAKDKMNNFVCQAHGDGGRGGGKGGGKKGGGGGGSVSKRGGGGGGAAGSGVVLVEGEGWRNEALHGVANPEGVPVIRLHRHLVDRPDAHQGWRGFGDVVRKWGIDCVHWCWSRALMAPSVAVLQRAVLAGVQCAAGRADMAPGSPARAQWLDVVHQKAAAKAARRRGGNGGGGGGGGGGDGGETEQQSPDQEGGSEGNEDDR
jgi:hypothetical protein